MSNLSKFVNKVLGINQAFEQLLDAGDIDGVKSRMDTHESEVIAAIEEYDYKQHAVNDRPDKIIYDKKGNIKGTVEMNKIPIPYEQYANEMALVFLFGRQLKWSQ
jgi:hypothetical protein